MPRRRPVSNNSRGVEAVSLSDIALALIPAAKNTILLTLICYPLAVLVATGAAALRLARIPLLSQLTAVVVDFLRITPLLLQLLFVYYGLPLVGVRMDSWPSAIATLAIHVGAYQSEIVRSSYLSVPRGLSEAARTLGMTDRIRVWRIVLPLALLLDTFRSTAVVSLVAVDDILYRAQQIIQTNLALGTPGGLLTTPVYFVVMVFFVGVGYPAARMLRTLERRVALP
jgi:His/Glu/Gln/Arg/opine family amino acid ABC transporter permease subunit